MKLCIKDGLKHIFYIELEISGDGINTFFNMCRKKDIIFFDVQHIKAGNNAVRARIARNDFFMIKNLVKAAVISSYYVKLLVNLINASLPFSSVLYTPAHSST